jgi:hypothetical protein
MDYAALKAEIHANPACADALEAKDCAALAAIVSTGRKAAVSREVGEGLISDALGIPAGPIFIKTLNAMAAATLPEGAPPEQQAQKAMIEQAARLIDKASLNVGMPSVRAGIDMMVGVLPLTQEQADAIKALAEMPAPVTAQDVARAVFNDDGSLK